MLLLLLWEGEGGGGACSTLPERDLLAAHITHLGHNWVTMRHKRDI
jgi:hypothetical protein